MRRNSTRSVLLGLAMLLVSYSVSAQWLTQSFTLKQGWNAVYLHVDASHETLENLVGAGAVSVTPIQEVWMWTPSPGTAQFVQTPQELFSNRSQWTSWNRNSSGNSGLQRLVGNVACLVYSSSVTDYVWTLKGRPKVPSYEWASSGLNFLGFPTSRANPPSFESFLAPAPILQQNAEIFEYPGGELGASNPVRVFGLRTTAVQRGRAYWVRAGNVYNRYFGPFEIQATSSSGIDFGTLLSVSRIRLRNLSSNDLTVSAEHIASEVPPAGQTTIVGAPPLLIRGALNTTDLTYGYSSFVLGGTQSWTLAPGGQPGSELELVIGLNRAALTTAPGEQLASVIRFTDSLGFNEVDLPVAAVADSNAGLWIGSASISKVRSSLKTFHRDSSGAPIMSTQANDFGSYVTTSVNNSLGDVPRSFPLRLILHNDNSSIRLLQRVYHGLDTTSSFVNATRQELLDPTKLGSARRVSAVHLPFTANNVPWTFSGALAPGATLTTTVMLPHDDHASNPFLHTFHPDHDNLGANFAATQLAPGFESYNVSRAITLSINPPADNFSGLTRSGQQYTGVYSETITLVGKQTAQGPESRSYESQGTFTLNRINSISALVTQ